MAAVHSAPRLLLPVPKWEWREPSLAQPKDQFGRQNRTRFKLELWKRDGGLVDLQWFDDRDEFDYALYRALIEDPHPDIVPMFAATTSITAGAGSNQTWMRPSDWNNGDNSVHGIGAGGTGGRAAANSQRHATGGGGGAWATRTNYAASATETYQLAAAISGGVSTGAQLAGTAGGDTWFGATTFAGSAMGAKGGSGGLVGTGSLNGGAGGDSASCIGSASFDGGRGGNQTGGSGQGASGGGGAAGPNGVGGNGADSSSTSNNATSGGQGDNATGGAAGTGNTSANGGDGGSGTEIPGTSIGAGGGGGGSSRSGVSSVSGSGGNYGGGGGGSQTSNSGSSATNGNGGQGAIWITYTPVLSVNPPKMHHYRQMRAA